MQSARTILTSEAHGSRTASAPLAGMRALVIEDEALVALDLEMTLKEAGAVVLGPFMRFDDAMHAAAELGAAAAVLDLMLGRDESLPLADMLTERGVALVFHSGHAATATLAGRYPVARHCPKPCTPAALVQAVARAIEG